MSFLRTPRRKSRAILLAPSLLLALNCQGLSAQTLPPDAGNFAATACQQGGSYLFSDGIARLEDLGIDQLLSAMFNPLDDITSRAKRKIRRAAARVAVGATLAGVCPPIRVGDGFTDLAEPQRLQRAIEEAFVPPGVDALDRDVDNPSDPGSCFFSSGLVVDSNDRITNFGVFDEQEWVYVDPFGPYPSFTSAPDAQGMVADFLIEEIRERISYPDFGIDSVIDLGVELPRLGPSLDDIIPGLGDLIVGLIVDNLDLQGVLDDRFNGWKLNLQPLLDSGIAVRSGTGTAFRAGPQIRLGVTGNLASLVSFGSVSYSQYLQVREHFPPAFSVLRVENAGTPDERHVVAEFEVEALDANGADLGSTPPYFADGDTTFTAVDNCDESPLTFNGVPRKVPLGTHYYPLSARDRSGNVTPLNYVVKVTAVDTLPPTIETPAPVGIEVPQGTFSLAFTSQGIGCLDYLCQTGSRPDARVHPPLFFDFSTLTPSFACQVDAGSQGDFIDCSTAQLLVGTRYRVRWIGTDASGNSAQVEQALVLRMSGSNQAPVAAGTSVTVAAGITTPIRLDAEDPEFDPLDYRLNSLPVHGDLGVDPTPLYQSRFTLLGLSQRLTSHVDMTLGIDTASRRLIADPLNQRIVQIDPSTGSVKAGLFFSDRQPYSLAWADGSEFIDAASDFFPPELLFADWSQGRVFSAREGDSGLDVSAFLGANPQHFVVLRDFANGGPVYFVITDPGDAQGVGAGLRVLTVSGYDPSQSTPPLASGLAVVASRAISLPAVAGIGIRPTGIAVDECSALTVTLADWESRRLHRVQLGSGTSLFATPVVQQTFSLANVFQSPAGGGLAALTDPQDILAAGGGCSAEFSTVNSDTRQVRRIAASVAGATDAGASNIGTRFVNPRRLAVEGLRGGESFYVLEDERVARFDRFGRLLGSMPTRLDETQLSFGAPAFSPAPLSGGDSEWVDFAVHDAAGTVTVFAISRGQNVDSTPIQGRVTWRDGFAQHQDASYAQSAGAGSSDAAAGRSIAYDPVRQRLYALTDRGLEFRSLRAAGALASRPSFVLFSQSSPVAALGEDGQSLAWASSAAIELGNAGIGGLERVRTDSRGDVYLTEPGRARVHKFHPDGAYVGWLGRCQSGSGCDVANQRSNGFTCSASRCSDGGVFAGSQPGQFAPGGGTVDFALAFDRSLDQIYVSDLIQRTGMAEPLARAQTFSLDGAFLDETLANGEPGNLFSFLEPGGFISVNDLAVNDSVFFVAEGNPFRRLHAFDASAFDVDAGGATVMYRPDDGYAGNDGFLYRAVDSLGASSPQASVAITVIEDTQPPQIVCPPLAQGQEAFRIEASTTGGARPRLAGAPTEGASVDLGQLFEQVVATDNIQIPYVRLENDAPSLIALGQRTVVRFTATDAVGQISQCDLAIDVVDTRPPEFIASPEPLTLEASGALTVAPVDLLVPPDVEDIGGGVTLQHDWPAQGLPLGEHVLTWTARDGAGNTAQVEQAIRIQDTRPPRLTFPGGAPLVDQRITAVNGFATVAAYVHPVAVDEVGLQIDAFCTPAPGEPIASVELLVACQAVDTAGNLALAEFSVFIDQPDSNGDGLSDLIAPPNRGTPSGVVGFSDAGLGGSSSGRVLNPAQEVVRVQDAWREAQGLRIAVEPAPQPSEVRALFCAEDRLRLSGFALAFDEEAEPIANETTASCSIDGLAVDNHFGDAWVEFDFATDRTAALLLPAPDAFTLNGTLLTADADNRAVLEVLSAGRSIAVAPGQTVDLLRQVNQPPISRGMPPIDLLEDAALFSADLGPVFDDVEDSDAQLSIVVLSNSQQSLFDAVRIVPVEQRLELDLREDANGVADLVLRAFDTYGDFVDQPVRVTVQAINDPPSFLVAEPPASIEDQGMVAVAGVATAVPGPANEASQAVEYVLVGNSAPELFAEVPRLGASGDLTYRAAPDRFGEAIVEFEVRDDGGTAFGGLDTGLLRRSLPIRVLAVNDPPDFVAGPAVAVVEDAGEVLVPGWASAIDAGAPGESNQVLHFQLESNSAPQLFAEPPTLSATGDLRVVLAADAWGSADLVWRLFDDGGVASGGQDASAAKALRVEVQGVNDPPRVRLSGDPQFAVGSRGSQRIADFFDADPGANEAGQQLAAPTLDVVSDPATIFGASPQLDGNALLLELSGRPGSAALRLGIQDDGGGDDRTEVDFNVLVLAGPDLALSLSNLSPLVRVGQPISYVLVARNLSSEAALGARVRVPIPASLLGSAWVCNPGDQSVCLASEGTETLDVPVDIGADDFVVVVLDGQVDVDQRGPFRVEGEVAPPVDQPDPRLSNNVSVDEDPVDVIHIDGFEEQETLESFIERVLRGG